MAVKVIDDVRRTGRVARQPIHTFNLKHQPFVIQPCLMAPVLPGETLKNLLLQSRCVTQPVENPLIGWWLEYYFFYVKLSQLDFPDDNIELGSDSKKMHLDLEQSMSGYAPAATTGNYYVLTTQGIDWTHYCLKLIVEEYFRDEGEKSSDHVVSQNGHDMPICALNKNSWMDSIRDATTLPTGGDLGDLETAAEDVTVAELEKAFQTYQFLLAQNMTDMTYEQFLKSHGVRGSITQPPQKPELIRYIRDWTYPSNTIDPTDGSASSALSWSVSERADKDRFFAEPGFIVGVTIARPKVYHGKQKAGMTQFLDSALAWMPAIMKDDPYTSLRQFTNAQGPLSGEVTNGYLVDLRDLYVYGDQFVNFDPESTGGGAGIAIDLPSTALEHRYATEALIDTLFTGSAEDSVRQDGVISLNIMGVQVDHT